MKKGIKTCSGLTALIPRYFHGEGNGTEVYYKDGSIINDNRKVKTILREIAKDFAADVAELRRKYGRVIGLKQQIPIPFSPEFILVPLKVRTPKIDGDGSYGYFSLEDIMTVEGDKESIIITKPGFKISILQDRPSTERRLNYGRIVQNAYLKQHGHSVYLMMKGNLGEYTKPATRGDIILLVKEISELKDKIYT